MPTPAAPCSRRSTARRRKQSPSRWCATPPGSTSTAARPRSTPIRSASRGFEVGWGSDSPPRPETPIAIVCARGLTPTADRKIARMADNTDLLPHEQPAPPRTDLWIAAVFLVFGAAVAWLAFLMPTYTDQKGEIYTAPGLVPGFYGAVIVLLSIWL